MTAVQLTFFGWMAYASVSHAGTEAQTIWDAHIRNQPTPRVLDAMEVLPMVCFTTAPGISPLTAVIADSIRFTSGVDFLQCRLHRNGILERARMLKGGTLSKDEEDRLTAFYEERLRDYRERPQFKAPSAVGFHFTFGLNDVLNLERTIHGIASLPEAIRRIERLHALQVMLQDEARPTFAHICKAIHMGLPPILQSRDGRWRICAGYLLTNNQLYLLLNDPATTPLTQRPPIILPQEWESEHPAVRSTVARMLKSKIITDYQLNTTIALPDRGFEIRPFEPDAYRAYYLHRWRATAQSMTQDICKILGVDAPKSERSPDPASTFTRRWDKCIDRNGPTILGTANAISMTLVKVAGHVTSPYAAFASVSCGRYGPGIAECVLEPKLFFRAARMQSGDWGSRLAESKRTALESLCARQQQAYAAGQQPFVSLIMNCHLPYAQAALRLACTHKGVEDPKKLTEAIATLNGWQSVCEGGGSVPWLRYQEAIDKGIPILLHSADKERPWLIACGYLEEDGTRFLLIADPLYLPDAEYRIQPGNDAPDSGICFEEFDDERYTPYFIHTWERSVACFAKQIEDILNAEGADQ